MQVFGVRSSTLNMTQTVVSIVKRKTKKPQTTHKTIYHDNFTNSQLRVNVFRYSK